ncbi:MAG TPA: hypothetical protein VFX95_06290 [Caulobacteraceae bacterium]|nr:hypothetical protein [Caulobacteraceae bacterium]
MFSNNRRRVAIDAAAVALILTATQAAPAYAYVDPGSVSIVITAILGGIAAVGYTLRSYFSRLKQFFSRKKP